MSTQTAHNLNKSPAFQFYPDKWQSHTRRLSDTAYRVYHELLCWMWQSSHDHCSVNASIDAVCVATAMPMDKVENAMAEIQNAHAPLLKEDGDKWVSNGLKKEAEKQADRRKKARKSANARWHNANASKTNANASVEQCSPSPSPSPSPSSKEITPKPPRKHIDNSVNKLTKQQFDDAFNRFWEVYPERRGKKKAKAKFRAALNAAEDTPTPEKLISMAERYANWCRTTGKESRFIVLPATWLNQGRWDDELDFKQEKPQQQQKFADPDLAKSQSLSGM